MKRYLNMKYAAVILLFVGLALAAPKQNPLLQADDCLHCVEDIVNAVADCEVRILIFPFPIRILLK